MSTHSLRDLRNRLGTIVREVAYTGHEAIITDSGREVAVIISMDDYERLHEHADIVDSLRFRELRDSDDEVMSLEDVMDALGVSVDDLAAQVA